MDHYGVLCCYKMDTACQCQLSCRADERLTIIGGYNRKKKLQEAMEAATTLRFVI